MGKARIRKSLYPLFPMNNTALKNEVVKKYQSTRKDRVVTSVLPSGNWENRGGAGAGINHSIQYEDI